MARFLKDIHDPHYVINLYNINRPKGAPVVQIGENEKNHFGTFACKQATYKCRIQNQYVQLRKEALKVNSITPMINSLEPLTIWSSILPWENPKRDRELD